MIYLDNAATTFPKPLAVTRRVLRCLAHECGNPGRGSHKMALRAAETVHCCRETASSFFGAPGAENVILTLNTTYALNMALKSILSPGDHVLAGNMEHNSVLRPLNALGERDGVTTDFFDVHGSADDVLAEQAKINASDVIVFIYPVFWSEAPAKLVGWFDRVWTYGFAYGEKTMKTLEKGLILCSAGNPRERLEEFGILDSMKKVMLGDRLFGRVKQSEFVVFDNTSREYELREKNREQHLKTAYEKGKNLLTHP